jgi:hypothetical protein
LRSFHRKIGCLISVIRSSPLNATTLSVARPTVTWKLDEAAVRGVAVVSQERASLVARGQAGFQIV